MGLPLIPTGPGFAITPVQAAFGTVLTALIPPRAGTQGGGPMPYLVGSGGKPSWITQPFTHLTDLLYNCGTTAHAIYVMRPLNWTYFSAAVAKNATAIFLQDDPGVYSTNYRNPLPGGCIGLGGAAVPCIADNAIATNDYVAFQLADGNWKLDTIASGTFAGNNLVLTTGTPNVTGATIAVNSPLFFFGIKTDTNPQTLRVHDNFLAIASTNRLLGGTDLINARNGEGFPTLNAGDPMAVLSNNATATGLFDLVAGDYRKY